MAVQAQYPSNIFLFNRNVQEGKTILGSNNDYSLQPQPDGDGGFLDQSHMSFNNNGVGVAHPRKRSREVEAANPTTATTTANMNSFGLSLQNHHHHHPQNLNHQLIDLSQLQNHHQQQPPSVVSTGLRLSFGDQTQPQIQQQQRQQQSIQQQHPTLFSVLSEELALQVKQQSDELNYILHAQGEHLRRTLAEKRQRHYRALVVAAEEAVARRMREKEEEMDKAARQNAELEAKAAQLSLEAQVWRAKAQAQEAHAATLQAQLQEAISNSISTSGAQQQPREGAGLGCAGEVEDSESAYVDPDSERRVNSPSCKVCQKRAVSVVLLPCRHLCVCGECDDVVQACPVCLSPRTASVEVYLT